MMRNPRKIIGQGCVRRGGNRRIVVDFDDETFAAIRGRAVAADTSFAEQVRTLVEWGLEADKA